jgi:uncharacterized protein (DUF2461 family)
MRESLHDEAMRLIKRYERYEEDNMSDDQKKLVENLMNCLRELAEHVREDIPKEQGSDHLWEAVEDAEFLLAFIEEGV